MIPKSKTFSVIFHITVIITKSFCTQKTTKIIWKIMCKLTELWTLPLFKTLLETVSVYFL